MSWSFMSHETLPLWREATNGPIVTCSNVRHSTIHHLNVPCWKKHKKNKQKPSLGPLVQSARHIKSSQFGVTRFLWLIKRHLVIHHILLHGKTLWGITRLQRLQANSHQLAILHACTIFAGYHIALLNHHKWSDFSHHSNSCDPCRGCSSLATGSGKHPYEPQNIKRIQKIHFTHKEPFYTWRECHGMVKSSRRMQTCFPIAWSSWSQ